jgi:hypothetical protein
MSTAYIRPEHLDFLEESKKVFEENPLRETHISKDDELIALRYGEDRDCVYIYSLSCAVAFFAQQIKPNPKPRRSVMEFAHDMEKQLKVNDHKGGWQKELTINLRKSLIQNFEQLQAELKKPTRDKPEITIRCANIANYAMMISDINGEHL